MRRVIFRLAFALTVALVTIGGLVVARTAPRIDSSPSAAGHDVTVEVHAAAATRLAGAIRFRTISTEDPSSFDASAFTSLHQYLKMAFPRVHEQLRREVIGSHSLLYTWQGSDASLPGILLAGHLDVVPVEPGTEKQWTHDPFEGRIEAGFIWGRGAIDNKPAITGTLEAIDMLLSEGFTPARTVYLAFGHDEEVGGTQGARQIADLLSARGVALEVVLDEGGVVGDGILAGVRDPVALIGIAEKGFVSVELTVRAGGGHSSLPPRETAVGILSSAIAKLERTQMASRLEGASRELFDRITPRLTWVQRVAFSNLWLTRPFVLKTMENVPATNAMIRTTTAPTIFQAGTKDNVLPGFARAVLNFRILPGDSVADVIGHVKRVIADSRVQVTIGGRFSAEPSRVSSSSSDSFRKVERSIRTVFPDAAVAPFLVVVVTDARYYASVSRNVYRFLPLRLTSSDIARMHGTDERIGIAEYEDAVRAYRQIVISLAAA